MSRKTFGMLGAAVLWAAAFAYPAAAQERGAEPVAPFEIAPGLWWVGASDVASYLIQTNRGLILIDGGYESTAPQILHNIRRLGFDPRQVKILLNTHAHLDHAGGLAALKAATGATLYASAEDAKLMARGGKGDYALGDRYPYPPVKADRILRDGQKVRLGERTLTARLTPGHTKGCTTWTFSMPDGGLSQSRPAMILCSNTVLPGVKLVDNAEYPRIAADFEKSYRFWRSAPCDLFLASHGQFFGMAEKRKAAEGPGALVLDGNPFVDPEGCRAFFERGYAAFQAELARQQSAGAR